MTVCISVSLQKVADLSMPSNSLPGVLVKKALKEDWVTLNEQGQESTGQSIGTFFFEERFEGILVPSARVKNAVNLVVFPENLQEESKVVPDHSEQLEN